MIKRWRTNARHELEGVQMERFTQPERAIPNSEKADIVGDAAQCVRHNFAICQQVCIWSLIALSKQDLFHQIRESASP